MPQKSQRVRQERSAGFIVYRIDDTGQRLYLALDQGNYWGLPKGHVERGETDLQAAIRELEEETGIDDPDVVDGFERDIDYSFQSRRKGRVHKVVRFFLCTTQRDDVVLSDEHVGYGWSPFPQILERLTYPATQDIVREAEALLAAAD